MGNYSQNMKDEKPPAKKVLLPEGSRQAKITAVEQKTSKAGNEMFVFDIKDEMTGNVDKFFCVTAKGKRWNLKMVLDACGVKADAEGEYKWEDSDVVGKTVVCDIVHEPNEFINREGQEVKTTQHRIKEITGEAWSE